MAYDKQPANWIKHQVLDNNVTMSISDKGSIMFRQTDNNKFLFCLTPSAAETMVNISGNLADLLVSPEYKAIIDVKQANKDKAYLAKQIQSHTEKAQKTIQAALDSLKASGMTEAEAKRVLKVS